jgi:hypothetical protein
MINEKFIDLMRIAEDDESIRTTLIVLLRQAPTRRVLALDELLSRMRKNGAPAELIAAIEPLREDGIAHKALELLDSDRKN